MKRLLRLKKLERKSDGLDHGMERSARIIMSWGSSRLNVTLPNGIAVTVNDKMTSRGLEGKISPVLVCLGVI